MKYLFGCLHEKNSKVIFLFWFQASTKYGIKVSCPNKLSLFVFIKLSIFFHAPRQTLPLPLSFILNDRSLNAEVFTNKVVMN